MESQSSQLAHRQLSSPRKRILVDARKLGDGGIGVYADNLIEGLLSYSENQLTVIGDPKRIQQFEWSDRVGVIADTCRSYSLDEMFSFAGRIPFQHFDLYHVPHYTLPYGIPIPTVVTVHDLIHIHFAEKWYYPHIASHLIRSALKRADRVITVSRATHDDLVRFVGGNTRMRSKMHVVPNAIDPFFLKAPTSCDYVQSRFHISNGYLLAVLSNLKPHKGLLDLLEAFQQILAHPNEAEGRSPRLVLAGTGTESIVEIEKLLERVGSIKEVHLLGRVSKEDLFYLYAGARALVVPSKAEGFCLPVLEAQAVGTPVLARPVPAVLELLTPRDIVCQDFSLGALRKGLEQTLYEEPEVEPKRSVGRPTDKNHLLKFDRTRLAETIMAIYSEAQGCHE